MSPIVSMCSVSIVEYELDIIKKKIEEKKWLSVYSFCYYIIILFNVKLFIVSAKVLKYFFLPDNKLKTYIWIELQ